MFIFLKCIYLINTLGFKRVMSIIILLSVLRLVLWRICFRPGFATLFLLSVSNIHFTAGNDLSTWPPARVLFEVGLLNPSGDEEKQLAL